MEPDKECEITKEQFRQLIQALDTSPGSSAEVFDVDGHPLVLDGRPAAAAEILLRPLIHQRGRITVDRINGQEPARQASIWLSCHGLLHAVASPTETVVLRSEPYESLYRMLIDAAGLQDSPALPKVDPVEVDRNDLRADEWSVETKKLEACARIRQLLPDELPEVAAALGAGEASLVSVAATWESPVGPQRGKMTWIATPAGLLAHEVQKRGLRNRHELDAEHPGWMWLRLIDRLPRADDLTYWQQEGETDGA